MATLRLVATGQVLCRKQLRGSADAAVAGAAAVAGGSNGSRRQSHTKVLCRKQLLLPTVAGGTAVIPLDVAGKTAITGGNGVSKRGKSSTRHAAAGVDLARHAPAPSVPRIVERNVGEDKLDLTFMDHHAAFKSKTSWEVFRALMVFKICGINIIVDNNEKLMKFGQAVFGKKLFGYLMKHTFYGQFVAGEDTVSITPNIERMKSFGVKSILDYSVEEDITEEEAKVREMESCISEADVKNDVNFAGIAVNQDKEFKQSDISLEKGEIKRYQAHREFGDRRVGVTSARTFFYQGEEMCDKNLRTFIKCIETVANTTDMTGFAAIKLTALGRPQILLQLSEVIAKAQKYHEEVTGVKGTVIEGRMSLETFEEKLTEALEEKLEDTFEENLHKAVIDNPEVQKWLNHMTWDRKGLIHLFSWGGLIDSRILLRDLFQVPNLKTGKMEKLITSLTDEEEEQFVNMMNRLHTVFKFAKERNVRVMVDAEQTYFQPAISRITMEMMKVYNTEKPIVFNTYQCYLRDAYKNLLIDLEQATRQKFFFGAKFVRGAYMEQERSRAAVLNYPDPINPNFEASTAMYHKCLEEGMVRMKNLMLSGKEKRVGIMVASHNEDSIRFAIRKMNEHGIKPEDKVICFGQLLGMCDQISFPMGQAGYSVYKYVPYGPVNEVLPYLSRRAYENKGIIEKLDKEKMLLWKELKNRMIEGRLFQVPEGRYKPI